VSLAVLGNAFGLAGVVLLAVPAWHAGRYAWLVTKAEATPAVALDLEAWRQRRLERLADLRRLRDSWGWWKTGCLGGGTLLAGASYLILLLDALGAGS